MTIGERIKNAREIAGLTQSDLAKKVGYKSYTTIAKIESGDRQLTQSKIMAFANALDIDPLYLIGIYENRQNKINELQLKQIPLIGKIACGSPMLANEITNEYRITDDSTHADFCIIAHGDSMKDAGIKDGDLIFCHRQESVENGEIAAVIIEDGAEYAEATLKRVYFYPEQNRIVLIAENPEYPALTFAGDNLKKVRIIGKAIACQSKLK